MTLALFEELIDKRRRLQGEQCWAVYAGPSTGSHVDFDFGKKVPRKVPILGNPHLSEDHKFYVGEASLFVQCAWRLDSQAEVVCGSTDSNSNEGPMLLGLRAMVGAVVEQVTIAKPALDLRLALSGGLFFSVFCDQTNVDDDEPNYALHTQERIYVVGPRGRVCCETPTEEPPRW